MRNIIKTTFGFIFVLLVGVNLFIFISSMNISGEINRLEAQTQKLHFQNIDLEMKVDGGSSLSHIASSAANLDFTKKVEPVYLDELKYAFRK